MAVCCSWKNRQFSGNSRRQSGLWLDGRQAFVVSLLDGKEISSYEVGDAVSSTPALRVAAFSLDARTARFTHSQPATKHPSRNQMTQKNLIKTDRETKDETKAGELFRFELSSFFGME